MLDRSCELALTLPDVSLRFPPETDVQIRYELQAGMHTVHHSLPFTLPERDALRSVDMLSDFDFKSERIVSREPELVERWHQWLWTDAHQMPQTDVQALGMSAILAEGCTRLTRVLPKILNEPG
jgi:hypothetical protein